MVVLMALARSAFSLLQQFFIIKWSILARFFVFGLLIGLGLFVLLFYWSELIALAVGHPVAYDQQPWYLHWVKQGLVLLPWLMVLVLGLFDLYRRNISRSLGFAGGHFLVYVALFFYVFAWPTLRDYFNQQAFNPAIWQANAPFSVDEPPKRQMMVRDLLKNHLHLGISRQEVEILLGKPVAGKKVDGVDYIYLLGPERGFSGIDFEWLGLKFTHDKLQEVKIFTD